jgi:hypothetical protein
MLSHDVVARRSLQSDKVRDDCLVTIGTHEGSHLTEFRLLSAPAILPVK